MREGRRVCSLRPQVRSACVRCQRRCGAPVRARWLAHPTAPFGLCVRHFREGGPRGSTSASRAAPTWVAVPCACAAALSCAAAMCGASPRDTAGSDRMPASSRAAIGSPVPTVRALAACAHHCLCHVSAAPCPHVKVRCSPRMCGICGSTFIGRPLTCSSRALFATL